ncbi:hypothetical protein GALL_322000 [mine drainage metagenome]|uniref:Uncharacterized protein n=1 Tax=mine drainage metagenome TaxID=410659 RepID=A0A1J5R8D4_9ZZZZ
MSAPHRLAIALACAGTAGFARIGSKQRRTNQSIAPADGLAMFRRQIG